MNSAQKERLRNAVDRYESVLYETGEWTASDLDGDFHERQATVCLLLDVGAVEVVDRRMTEHSPSKPVHIYEWDRELQQYVQDYYEERDELPCGCRSHVPPTTDGDLFVCKFCGDRHSRDVVENAL